MSGDKRSVTTDALDTLGQFHWDDQHRDAIHLAVEQVRAGEELAPGQHIDVRNGIASATEVNMGLGIVDPFLDRPARKGERFWFVMYPRMVHSLRHVWSHPAFPDEKGVASTKAAAESWLRHWCQTHDAPSYEDFIEEAEQNQNEEYLHMGNRDAHCQIPDAVWDRVAIVTGRRDLVRAKYFSCSC